MVSPVSQASNGTTAYGNVSQDILGCSESINSVWGILVEAMHGHRWRAEYVPKSVQASPLSVIPAQAGTQVTSPCITLGSRSRGNDGHGLAAHRSRFVV